MDLYAASVSARELSDESANVLHQIKTVGEKIVPTGACE
jgi:hypothetical protein